MMLTACGYDTHGVDGNFGNNTLNALRAYQSDHSLAVDGIYGTHSRASLTQVYQATR